MLMMVGQKDGELVLDDMNTPAEALDPQLQQEAASDGHNHDDE
jgi:hypothetical protein